MLVKGQQTAERWEDTDSVDTENGPVSFTAGSVSTEVIIRGPWLSFFVVV